MTLSRLAPWLLLLASVAAHAADRVHVCRSPDGRLFGYGNRICQISVPYKYVMTEPFTADGLAAVSVMNDHGFGKGVVDRTGKEVVPPVYRDIDFGPAGQILATREDDTCPFHPAPTIATLFDARGRPMLAKEFAGLGFFRQGLAWAMALPEGEARCNRHNAAVQVDGIPDKGFIDRGGQFVIPPRFANAYDFAANGRALVHIGQKWGFIDKRGELVIAAVYDHVAPATDEIFRRDGHLAPQWGFGDLPVARVDGRDGMHLIDASGKTVGRGGWLILGAFDEEGLATALVSPVPPQHKVGLVDMQGKVVLEPVHDRILPFSNGFAAVEDGGKWGFIDTHGKLVVPVQFADQPQPGFSRHGVAKVMLHGGRDPADPKLRSMGFGYIDTHGAVVIDKDDYDRVDAFQDAMDDPLARAVKGGRTGYLDTHGKLALGWFDAGTSFGADGLAAVKVDGRFGFITRQGKFAIAPAYDDALAFDGDTAVVRRGAKWGIVDHAGQVVVPFEYDKLAGFGGESVTLGTRNGREVGVDRHGKPFDLPPLGPLRGVPVDDL